VVLGRAGVAVIAGRAIRNPAADLFVPAPERRIAPVPGRGVAVEDILGKGKERP